MSEVCVEKESITFAGDNNKTLTLAKISTGKLIARFSEVVKEESMNLVSTGKFTLCKDKLLRYKELMSDNKNESLDLLPVSKGNVNYVFISFRKYRDHGYRHTFFFDFDWVDGSLMTREFSLKTPESYCGFEAFLFNIRP